MAHKPSAGGSLDVHGRPVPLVFRLHFPPHPHPLQHCDTVALLYGHVSHLAGRSAKRSPFAGIKRGLESSVDLKNDEMCACKSVSLKVSKQM
eukprot:COSAG05_NODE_292_length_12012_cov_12.968354_2_plen_92_part_00